MFVSGTPKAAGGRDVFAIGWYRVTIGNERLAQTREEAKCGANYQGRCLKSKLKFFVLF